MKQRRNWQELLATKPWEDTFEVFRTDAFRRHKSLLGIVQVSQDFVYNSPQELLDHTGFGRYKQVSWNYDDNQQNYIQGGKGDGDVGGGVVFVYDDDGTARSVVHVKGTSIDDELGRSLINSCFFWHEIGHVDDFERQVSLVPSKVDFLAAEVYAHRFACRKFVREQMPACVAIYLKVMVKSQLDSNSAVVRDAIFRFTQSGEYKDFESFSRSVPNDFWGR